MRPPVAPVETPSAIGWQSVEATMRIELPSDYKEFIAYYGTGAVDNFLVVLNPFSCNDNLNLIKRSGSRGIVAVAAVGCQADDRSPRYTP